MFDHCYFDEQPDVAISVDVFYEYGGEPEEYQGRNNEKVHLATFINSEIKPELDAIFTLDNARYRIQIDDDGDEITSTFIVIKV